MGIKSLYTQWLAHVRYPGVRLRSVPRNVSGLFLDANGIFHTSAQAVYAYGQETPDLDRLRRISRLSDAELEAEFFATISGTILDLVHEVRPQKALVIAVDGVAPPAKLNQQRSRRYTAGETGSRFNPSAITPGTEMMERLNQYLRRWLAEHRQELPPQVIYSSHRVFGEGEHKIFRYLRDRMVPEGTQAIYGLDGDLVMLSLVSPARDIILIREDLSDVISLQALRRGLAGDLKLEASQAVRDFVVLAYLAGNDFLPRLFAIHDLGSFLNLAMNVYRQVYEATQVPLTDAEGHLEWETLANILETLKTAEAGLLIEKAAINFRHPSKLLDAASVKTLLDASQRQKDTWFTVTDFDFETFRNLWYSNALGPRTLEGKLALETLGVGVSAEDLLTMSRWYLYGLEWILHYYLGKIPAEAFAENPPPALELKVAPGFIYPYNHAPLITDLADTLSTCLEKEAHPKGWLPMMLPVTPFYLAPHYQLVTVIPLRSASVFPADVAFLINLIRPTGLLGDLCPEKVEIEREGLFADHGYTPILPRIDLQRVIAAVNTLLQPNGEGKFITPNVFIAEADLVI